MRRRNQSDYGCPCPRYYREKGSGFAGPHYEYRA